jgi:general secretion pathway protein D
MPGATPAPGDVAITSGHPLTNTAPEEMLPKGLIDFRGASLDQVLELYSMLVNRTILRPATLASPPIILTTRDNLTMKEGMQALEAVLAMNSISLINFDEKFVKVVPSATALTTGPKPSELTADQLEPFGNFVVHYVTLKYVKPTEILPMLTPIASANGVTAFDPAGMLVLHDNVENVKRMLELIDKLDVFVPAEYTNEVIAIKYAFASDIASALSSLGGGGGVGTISASSHNLGGGINSPRSSGLGSMGSGSYPGGMGGVGGIGGMGGMGAQGTMSPLSSSGISAPSTAGTPSASSSLSGRLASIIQTAARAPGATGNGDIQIFGQTKIIADERINSLIVWATRRDMETIKKIISQLDVVLAQVMIEAVIMQVSLGDSASLGVSWLQKQPQGSGNFAGIGAINNGSFLNGSSFLAGGTNSVLPSGFSYLASFGNDLDVTVAALASDNRAKILQRPRVQTSNAKPAHLFVGESRPYPVSSYYGGGSYGQYSSVQQLPIGVTLDLTPLINVDGLVVMHISVNIQSVSGTVSVAGVGDVPITSLKEAESDVAVRNRETIMLGGLIENDGSHNASGVPILKDIPVLGALFRSSSSSKSRNEMIVLIRPTVLETPAIASIHAENMKNDLPGIRQLEREFQKEEEQLMKGANLDETKQPN